MAQQSNDLRERLLATLPQPENVANYREEAAKLLARHAKALRWEKYSANLILLLGTVLFIRSSFAGQLGVLGVRSLQFASAFMYFVGTIFQIRYRIYESQVATLKEIKQVQLQILELQASLQKD